MSTDEPQPSPKSMVDALRLKFEADALFANGHYQEAYDKYKLVAEFRDPTLGNLGDAARPRAELKLGICAWRLGQDERTFAHFKTAHELAPHELHIAGWYAVAALRYGQRNVALEVTLRALNNEVAIVPDEHKDTIMGTLWQTRAKALLQSGDKADRPEALLCLNSAAGLGLSNNALHDQRGWLILHEKGDYQAALLEFEKVDYKDALGQPENLALRAFCRDMLGDSQGAAADYAASVGVWKKIGKPRVSRLIEDFFNKGQVSLNYLDWRAQVTKANDRRYPNILRLKAITQRDMGDTDMAEETLTRILPRAFMAPARYPHVFATAAKLMELRGDFESAVALNELAFEGVARRSRYGNGTLQMPVALRSALNGMTSLRDSAAEGGYPVLAHICGENIATLQAAITEQQKTFPSLKPLALELK